MPRSVVGEQGHVTTLTQRLLLHRDLDGIRASHRCAKHRKIREARVAFRVRVSLLSSFSRSLPGRAMAE